MGSAQTFPSRSASSLSLGTDYPLPPAPAFPHSQIPILPQNQDFFLYAWARAVLTQHWLSLLAKPLLPSGATHAFAAPGHPSSRSRSDSSLLSPVLKILPSPPQGCKVLFFSRSYPRGPAGTQSREHCLADPPAPGRIRPSSPSKPQAVRPQRSAGGCWTKGGGVWGGGAVRLLQCPQPTLHCPRPAPPFSGLG